MRIQESIFLCTWVFYKARPDINMIKAEVLFFPMVCITPILKFATSDSFRGDGSQIWHSDSETLITGAVL